MNKVGLFLLIPFTAIISSGITYYLTSNEPLLIRYEPVTPIVSQATASEVCANYLHEDLMKGSSDAAYSVRIIDSKGYGFSLKEIYCEAVVEETNRINIGNKTNYVEKTHHHFSIEDRIELQLYRRNEFELDEAIKRYKERFKL